MQPDLLNLEAGPGGPNCHLPCSQPCAGDNYTSTIQTTATEWIPGINKPMQCTHLTLATKHAQQRCIVRTIQMAFDTTPEVCPILVTLHRTTALQYETSKGPITLHIYRTYPRRPASACVDCNLFVHPGSETPSSGLLLICMGPCMVCYHFRYPKCTRRDNVTQAYHEGTPKHNTTERVNTQNRKNTGQLTGYTQRQDAQDAQVWPTGNEK
jgi:hypothetical protein